MKTFSKILLFCVFSIFIIGSAFAGLSDLFEEAQPQVHYCQNDDCGLDEWINQLKTIDDVVTDRAFSVYAQDIVRFLLGFVYLVAVCFIIYAGFHLLTWVWDEEKSKKSKTMIVYVIVGILIIFLAWPITQFILNVLNVTTS